LFFVWKVYVPGAKSACDSWMWKSVSSAVTVVPAEPLLLEAGGGGAADVPLPEDVEPPHPATRTTPAAPRSRGATTRPRLGIGDRLSTCRPESMSSSFREAFKAAARRRRPAGGGRAPAGVPSGYTARDHIWFNAASRVDRTGPSSGQVRGTYRIAVVSPPRHVSPRPPGKRMPRQGRASSTARKARTTPVYRSASPRNPMLPPGCPPAAGLAHPRNRPLAHPASAAAVRHPDPRHSP
jgi:hypothetical protein